MKSENISDMVVEHILMRSNEELAKITVQDISNTLGMNPTHISRTFRKDKKFPLSVYLVKLKVLRAASTLRQDNNITVAELAKNMGFRTTGSFTRVFKQYFGASPDKFREYRR